MAKGGTTKGLKAPCVCVCEHGVCPVALVGDTEHLQSNQEGKGLKGQDGVCH